MNFYNSFKVWKSWLEIRVFIWLTLTVSVVSVANARIVFLPDYPLSNTRKELASKLPRNYQVSFKDLSNNGIEHSTIFHGSKSIDDAITMLQDHKIIIESDRSILVNGRGWYFSGGLVVPSGWAGINGPNPGAIIPARIKNGVTVLSWSFAVKDPYYIAILKQFNETDRSTAPLETFSELARRGVDLVLTYGGDIVVLNLSALELPHSIDEVGEFFLNRALDERLRWGARYESFVIARPLLKRELLQRNLTLQHLFSDSSFKADFLRDLTSDYPLIALDLLEREPEILQKEKVAEALTRLSKQSVQLDSVRSSILRIVAGGQIQKNCLEHFESIGVLEFGSRKIKL